MRTFLIAAALLAFGAGCDGPSGEPDSMATSEMQVENMVKARALFDKSAGKWENLTPTEQAEYTNLVGGTDADREKWWSTMTSPMSGGGVPPGGPGPSGP